MARKDAAATQAWTPYTGFRRGHGAEAMGVWKNEVGESKL
jgi:hypothetical protein